MALFAGLLAPGLTHTPSAFGSTTVDAAALDTATSGAPVLPAAPALAAVPALTAAAPDATSVPCDPNALIVAILRANAEGRGILSLADRCTYTLTVVQPGPNGPIGLPAITSDLTIHGNRSTIVRAAAAATFRFFEVPAGGTLELDHITLTGGQDTSAGGGGAIYGEGTIGVTHSTFTGNTARSGGGAIRSFGVLTVKDSLFAENSSTGDSLGNSGGAIDGGGVVEIERTKVRRNSTAQAGGGISYGGPLFRLTDSVVEDNQAQSGGGVDARGVVTIVGSTISDNHVSQTGGGVFFDDFVTVATIRDSRIAGNTATTGAGIASFGQLTVQDTKVTGNRATSSGGAIVTSQQLVLRDSELTGNRAFAFAGLRVESGTADLFDTKVTGNSSTNQPGGIGVDTGDITLDPETVVINNRPTNCAGSPVAVPGCFG